MSTPAGVVVVALLISVILALRLLAFFDWDPTVFTAFGEEALATTRYAEEKLGREVLVRPEQGHDGKFFFVQANDPLLHDPDENAEVLDRPAYRSQRMLYPLLAGGFGLFSADVVIWAMPLVNVAALAVGSWAVAKIAVKHGAPAWVGLGFVLNIGLLSELFIDGAGIVSFCLACLGVLALEHDRMGVGAAAFAAAALTREVMALFIVFLALFWLARRRSFPWSVTVPAGVAVIAWAVFVRMRIDLETATAQVQELTPIPFSGMSAALSSGRGVPLDYVVIGIFLVLLFLVPYRALRSGVLLSWGAVGFAALAPFLTQQVWQKSFDISRALAPLVTVFLLELVLARQRRHRTEWVGEPQVTQA